MSPVEVAVQLVRIVIGLIGVTSAREVLDAEDAALARAAADRLEKEKFGGK